jgi:hypothetical protein
VTKMHPHDLFWVIVVALLCAWCTATEVSKHLSSVECVKLGGTWTHFGCQRAP